MAISWHMAPGPAGTARPRIGHPRRDRAKVKASRKAARRTR